MTDELDSLRAALKATPAPDPAARDRALARAMQNFDRHQAAAQGTAGAARPRKDRPPKAGFLDGVRSMLTSLAAKPALAATTSVAALAVGLAFLLPLTPRPPLLPPAPPKAEAPAAPPAPAQGDTAAPTGAPTGTATGTAPEAAGTATGTAAPADLAEATIADAAPAVGAGAEAEGGAEGGAGADGGAVARKRAADAPAHAPADGPASPPASPPDSPPDSPPASLATESVAAEGDAATALAEPVPMAPVLVPGLTLPSPTQPGPTQPALTLPGPLPDVSLPPDPAARTAPGDNTEAYASAAPNPVKITAEEPVSTFSTDVDTASWALLRSTVEMGMLPTPDQIRIEEMVNYFPYDYPAPKAGAAFATTVTVMPTPWNPGTQLVTIGLQGALPAVGDRPPLNLVFLVDTSGSMDDPRKLGLLKQSLALVLPQLRPGDQVALVAYAGSAGLVLPPTPAAERDTILAALEGLSAGGATAGAEGIELAYRTAAAMAGEGEVSRVLLATDGDFNLGLSDPGGLAAYVAARREAGLYLSVLGFGRGNLDDATMQALAQNGNGTAAYIDTLSEAQKVLVDQLTGALFPIADDVKVQVEWNPAKVAEYRLIGYETRALRREDFNNDKVDAGEIGAGLQVTAIYEITPVGSDAVRNDPLRYGPPPATAAPDAGPDAGPEGSGPEGSGPVGSGPDELGFLRLRWKAPGAADSGAADSGGAGSGGAGSGEVASTLLETPITGREAAGADSRFAAAIAGFGQLLQGQPYLGSWGWDAAIALAEANRGEDPFGYRAEAVRLMRLAQSLTR